MDTTEKQTRSESFGKKSKQTVRIQWKRKKIPEITCERVLMIICYTVWQKQTKSWCPSAGCHSSVRRNRQNYVFLGGEKAIRKVQKWTQNLKTSFGITSVWIWTTAKCWAQGCLPGFVMEGRKAHETCDHSGLEISFLLRQGKFSLCIQAGD